MTSTPALCGTCLFRRLPTSPDAATPRNAAPSSCLVECSQKDHQDPQRADAEIKIVGTDGEVRLDREKIARLNIRLNELEVFEDREEMKGMLLGILPDRQQYEFKVGDDGPIIFGPVSEDLNEHYLTSADFATSILLKPVTAQFLVITKVHGGQIQSQQKVLEQITLADAVKSG